MLAAFPSVVHALPSFTDDGVLPPGDYSPTRDEFERQFVNVGNASRREEIYAGWNRHRDALQRDGLTVTARELLDGSFTEATWAPKDIDIVVEYPVTSTELRLLTPSTPILRLLQGTLTKAEYHCDAYPLFFLPEDDPAHQKVTVDGLRYWMKWFGRTRMSIEKGRVWASVSGFDERA